MGNSKKIILVASIVAGAVAFIIAKRKRKKTPSDFAHFKKNRHLTPFANMRKHPR